MSISAPKSWAAMRCGNLHREWTRCHGSHASKKHDPHRIIAASCCRVFMLNNRWQTFLYPESSASSSCAFSGKRPRIAETMRESSARLHVCVPVDYVRALKLTANAAHNIACITFCSRLSIILIVSNFATAGRLWHDPGHVPILLEATSSNFERCVNSIDM